MATRPQLPGTRWFLWLRIASLRIGVLTGIYLSCVFVAWLEIANRVPGLWHFAELRNLVAGGVPVLGVGDSPRPIPPLPRKLFFSCLAAPAPPSPYDIVAGKN